MCVLSCYAQLLGHDPLHCSLPGSSVHGISQTRILEWVAISSPGDLPDPRTKPTSLGSPALAGGFFVCLYFCKYQSIFVLPLEDWKCLLLSVFFFQLFILFWMINNVELVSGVQQSDSVIHMHVSILSQILLRLRWFHNIEQSFLPCSVSWL